jgi:hypothetical protein
MTELPRQSDKPWESEPDSSCWVDPETRSQCMARRGPSGHWCGYVGLPRDHPAFGVDDGDVDVDVHGGLTFSGTVDVDPEGLWWLGFDCAHLGDLVPGLDRIGAVVGDSVYRDLDYVRGECARLAAQLARPLKIRRWRIEG